jgi:hypothetical protein
MFSHLAFFLNDRHDYFFGLVTRYDMGGQLTHSIKTRRQKVTRHRRGRKEIGKQSYVRYHRKGDAQRRSHPQTKKGVLFYRDGKYQRTSVTGALRELMLAQAAHRRFPGGTHETFPITARPATTRSFTLR